MHLHLYEALDKLLKANYSVIESYIVAFKVTLIHHFNKYTNWLLNSFISQASPGVLLTAADYQLLSKASRQICAIKQLAALQ